MRPSARVSNPSRCVRSSARAKVSGASRNLPQSCWPCKVHKGCLVYRFTAFTVGIYSIMLIFESHSTRRSPHGWDHILHIPFSLPTLPAQTPRLEEIKMSLGYHSPYPSVSEYWFTSTLDPSRPSPSQLGPNLGMSQFSSEMKEEDHIEAQPNHIRWQTINPQTGRPYQRTGPISCDYDDERGSSGSVAFPISSSVWELDDNAGSEATRTSEGPCASERDVSQFLRDGPKSPNWKIDDGFSSIVSEEGSVRSRSPVGSLNSWTTGNPGYATPAHSGLTSNQYLKVPATNQFGRQTKSEPSTPPHSDSSWYGPDNNPFGPGESPQSSLFSHIGSMGQPPFQLLLQTGMNLNGFGMEKEPAYRTIPIFTEVADRGYDDMQDPQFTQVS